MQNPSLSAYCKRHNLPKSSVYKALKAEGFDTSSGLSPEAVAFADSYFLDSPTPTLVATALPTIATGNHRGQLALPQQPSTLDLGVYRGEHAPLTTFEPQDIERFLDSCDGFLEAVEADFYHQQAVTQRKEQAAAVVRAKVEQVKQAQLVYQLRSESLALHNRALDAELQQGMTALGKPQSPADQAA
jgi:hypothetical protein